MIESRQPAYLGDCQRERWSTDSSVENHVIAMDESRTKTHCHWSVTWKLCLPNRRDGG